MSPYRDRILRLSSVKPCGVSDFTSSATITLAVSRSVLEGLFASLVADGLIYPAGGERYLATAAGLAELSKPTTIAGPRADSVMNLDPWVPPAWEVARPGADSHRAFRSFGAGC